MEEVDFEFITGRTFPELARASYEVSSLFDERGRTWEELDAHEQLGIEMGLRQLEAIANGSPKSAEHWKAFKQRRLESKPLKSRRE